MSSPIDAPLGPAGMRALQREREENRRLRAELHRMKAVMVQTANQLIDTIETGEGNE